MMYMYNVQVNMVHRADENKRNVKLMTLASVSYLHNMVTVYIHIINIPFIYKFSKFENTCYVWSYNVLTTCTKLTLIWLFNKIIQCNSESNHFANNYILVCFVLWILISRYNRYFVIDWINNILLLICNEEHDNLNVHEQ